LASAIAAPKERFTASLRFSDLPQTLMAAYHPDNRRTVNDNHTQSEQGLALDAFGTLFNKRDYEAATHFWSVTRGIPGRHPVRRAASADQT
jgi:hypothetical protein